ncbi:hypothetical protein Pst134EB_014507 [Puccinia striiformis f. sp. tritici]|uniref:rRNA-processing protein n=1 Tax=Puccinia striiformis f. sp. tritici PST-78 TaxID=1165861 RepID=A0A0L0VWB1_9BASI|nr:hypothetical protein Pst134EB_014507 [Puccinia striiformis f. sp. tritici]KNF03462.1 hypothetical protein PSTG_03402 [Puccinia striiformis f. sp. tritici PST-78]
MTTTTGNKQSISWHKRQEERKKMESIKILEREIKDQQEQEQKLKIEKIKARKLKIKENERLEKLKLKISLKKLMRIKKREGRTKKISG